MLNYVRLVYNDFLERWVLYGARFQALLQDDITFDAERYSDYNLFVRDLGMVDGFHAYAVFERKHMYVNEGERRVTRVTFFDDGTIKYY